MRRDATAAASSDSPRAAACDAPEQLLPGRVLEEVTDGAGLDRPHDVVVGVVGGEDENLDPGMLGPDPPRGLHPVDSGHAEVHEHDVGR